MKFRRLTSEELTHLEKEFVEFLVSNTVTADDWVKVKEEQPEKAEELILMFSEVVLDKVYSKVVLLEKRESNNLLFFRFDGELIQMLGISTEDNSIDFTALDQSVDYTSIKLNGFRTSKVVAKETKSEEVFRLIESGCIMGNADLYKTLDSIIE